MGIIQEKRAIRKSVAATTKQETVTPPEPVADPIREMYERQQRYDKLVDGLLDKQKRDKEISIILEQFNEASNTATASKEMGYGY